MRSLLNVRSCSLGGTAAPGLADCGELIGHRLALACGLGSDLGPATDDLEQVVEVVSEAASKAPNGVEALRLLELALQGPVKSSNVPTS